MTAGGHVGRLLRDTGMSGTAQGTFDVTVQPGAAIGRFELSGTTRQVRKATVMVEPDPCTPPHRAAELTVS